MRPFVLINAVHRPPRHLDSLVTCGCDRSLAWSELHEVTISLFVERLIAKYEVERGGSPGG